MKESKATVLEVLVAVERSHASLLRACGEARDSIASLHRVKALSVGMGLAVEVDTLATMIEAMGQFLEKLRADVEAQGARWKKVLEAHHEGDKT